MDLKEANYCRIINNGGRIYGLIQRVTRIACSSHVLPIYRHRTRSSAPGPLHRQISRQNQSSNASLIINDRSTSTSGIISFEIITKKVHSASSTFLRTSNSWTFSPNRSLASSINALYKRCDSIRRFLSTGAIPGSYGPQYGIFPSYARSSSFFIFLVFSVYKYNADIIIFKGRNLRIR
jgi:hypothetical protein